MHHKHFQSAKRPLSVIFHSKPTNQVIRYEHEGQVSAKIMLEQKADFKIRLKLVNARSRTTIQKCQWNQSTKRISQLKNIFIICTKTFIQYQRHHCSDGLRDCGCFITFTTISTTTVI